MRFPERLRPPGDVLSAQEAEFEASLTAFNAARNKTKQNQTTSIANQFLWYKIKRP